GVVVDKVDAEPAVAFTRANGDAVVGAAAGDRLDGGAGDGLSIAGVDDEVLYVDAGDGFVEANVEVDGFRVGGVEVGAANVAHFEGNEGGPDFVAIREVIGREEE